MSQGPKKNRLTKSLAMTLLAYFIFVWIIVLLLGLVSEHDVLSSLGVGALSASAFLLITTPNSSSASSYALVGGYAIGIAAGVIWHAVADLRCWTAWGFSPVYSYDLFGALAVVTAAAMMIRLRLFHPPCVGIAYGFVIETWDDKVIVLIIVTVLLLVSLKQLTRNRLSTLHH